MGDSVTLFAPWLNGLPFQVQEASVWDGVTLFEGAASGSDEALTPVVGQGEDVEGTFIETGYPLGFTLEELAAIFYRVRKIGAALTVNIDIPSGWTGSGPTTGFSGSVSAMTFLRSILEDEGTPETASKERFLHQSDVWEVDSGNEATSENSGGSSEHWSDMIPAAEKAAFAATWGFTGGAWDDPDAETDSQWVTPVTQRNIYNVTVNLSIGGTGGGFACRKAGSLYYPKLTLSMSFAVVFTYRVDATGDIADAGSETIPPGSFNHGPASTIPFEVRTFPQAEVDFETAFNATIFGKTLEMYGPVSGEVTSPITVGGLNSLAITASEWWAYAKADGSAMYDTTDGTEV